MDEWSTRKKVVVVLIVLLALSPLTLLTEAIPGRIQGWVDGHAESSLAPWVQMKLATVYGWTLRRDQMYNCYTRYLELFGKDNPNYEKERYIDIELERAVLTGQIFTATRGMEELTKFMQKYAGTPQAAEARKEYDKVRLRM